MSRATLADDRDARRFCRVQALLFRLLDEIPVGRVNELVHLSWQQDEQEYLSRHPSLLRGYVRGLVDELWDRNIDR